jgi:hypothetical protein
MNGLGASIFTIFTLMSGAAAVQYIHATRQGQTDEDVRAILMNGGLAALNVCGTVANIYLVSRFLGI